MSQSPDQPDLIEIRARLAKLEAARVGAFGRGLVWFAGFVIVSVVVIVVAAIWTTHPDKKAAERGTPITSANQPPAMMDVSRVSLITLIANPATYDGKRVRVIGFLRLEFEGNNLYVAKSDYEAAISKNAVW